MTKAIVRTKTRTRSGLEFDCFSDTWNYRDGIKTICLRFNEVRAPLSIREALKVVLTWYAEHESPSHLGNLFHRFKHFAISVELATSISSSDLINYRTTLHPGIEWYLGSLSGLLKRWHQMQIPGVADDAITYLNAIRIKGNRKGVAVLTMDPCYGRFTDIEFESILVALKTAYDNGQMGKGEYVLTWLFIALGPRPIQYAAMKICDLSVIESSGADPIYVLAVPRAKRRGETLRGSFKKRTLTPEIGRLVKEYVDEVRGRFGDLLSDPEQAPMFPTDVLKPLEEGRFRYHRTDKSLGRWFQQSMMRLNVRSERTGNLMKMPPIRFRRTLACRAADEGHGEFVIAELLDHSDTQNVGAYVEASAGMMERIDEAVALKLAPMAQAFAGVILANESEARRSGDRTSRIHDPRFDSRKPVGNCGQFGFCGLLAPLACYTCRSFEPWLDGPHEKVLDFLIADRERLLLQADRRIASINDRTLLAVAEVVRRCAVVKTEIKEDQNG